MDEKENKKGNEKENEKGSPTIDDILKICEVETEADYLTFLNRWIVARFVYRLGIQYTTDSQYDAATKLLKSAHKSMEKMSDADKLALQFLKVGEYLGRVYEEDPIPEREMYAIGINDTTVKALIQKYAKMRESSLSILNAERNSKFENRKILVDGKEYKYKELHNYIEDLKSESAAKSITPVETYEEAFEWFQKFKGREICASLKIDGINIRAFYVNGHFVHACTRGRAGNEMDHTLVLSKQLPWEIKDTDGNPVTGIIRGEVYVDKDKLDYLAANYKSDYVVPRTAATTMLTVPHLEEDYKYLKFTCFNGLHGGYLCDRLDWAATQGFDVVPNTIIKWEGTTFQEFKKWMSDFLDDMWFIGELSGIKTDGVVVELNSSEDYEKYVTDGNYDAGNLALKIGKWEPGVYSAKLEEIVVERKPASNQFSCRGRITPTKVASGITVTLVNLFNLGLVSAYDLSVGDTIHFMFKNDNAIQWVYNLQERKEEMSEAQKKALEETMKTIEE